MTFQWVIEGNPQIDNEGEGRRANQRGTVGGILLHNVCKAKDEEKKNSEIPWWLMIA